MTYICGPNTKSFWHTFGTIVWNWGMPFSLPPFQHPVYLKSLWRDLQCISSVDFLFPTMPTTHCATLTILKIHSLLHCTQYSLDTTWGLLGAAYMMKMQANSQRILCGSSHECAKIKCDKHASFIQKKESRKTWKEPSPMWYYFWRKLFKRFLFISHILSKTLL